MKTNGHAHNPRFKPLRFGEIALDTTAKYIVKNLIPAGGLVVVWGPPKCGKSFLVSDLALHVALGWPYRGLSVEPGTVMYVTCEGQSGFPARIEAFRLARMTEEVEEPPFHLLPTRLDLISDHQELAIDIAAHLGNKIVRLLILDTLNRSLNGSESKDEDMSAYIQACDYLREYFECTVIVIHHCGIEGSRPRGHTSLSGAADTQIAVKKNEFNQIVATVEYMKDGLDGAEIASRLEIVQVGLDDEGDKITSCVIEPLDQFEQPTKKPKTARLSEKAQVILDALKTAVASDGKPAPTHNHIPNTATVVDVELWRRCYYAVIPDDKADARRKSFSRGIESLLAKHVVGIHSEIAWIVEAGHSGT